MTAMGADGVRKSLAFAVAAGHCIFGFLGMVGSSRVFSRIGRSVTWDGHCLNSFIFREDYSKERCCFLQKIGEGGVVGGRIGLGFHELGEEISLGAPPSLAFGELGD